MSAIAPASSEMAVAGRGGRRRLDVEHRRQGVVLNRRILFEPAHLLDRRPAPVDEMIGAVRNAGSLCAGPVGLKTLIEAIPALGRLDPGEFDAAIGDRVPIDVPLELGDIDAVDRVVLGVGVTQADGIQGADGAPATRQQGGKPQARPRSERRTVSRPASAMLSSTSKLLHDSPSSSRADPLRAWLAAN